MTEIEIKVRTEQAVENFRQGYNCSQSVAMAYADLYPVDMETIKQISGSFGGGMGRLREVCGAVTGAFMILGMENPASDPNDKNTKSANYAAVQHTARQFKERMGSYICADLLKIGRRPQDPNPEDRNSAYYAKRPCAYCVAVGAELLGKELMESEKSKTHYSY
jgi:C_GCAxxG_C_C family probable redox protein